MKKFKKMFNIINNKFNEYLILEISALMTYIINENISIYPITKT